MAPKKGAEGSASTERRVSARIASQPPASAGKDKTAAASASAGKKRASESGEAQESKAKKTAELSASKKAKLDEKSTSDAKPASKSQATKARAPQPLPESEPEEQPKPKPSSKSEKKTNGTADAAAAAVESKASSGKTKLEVGDKLPEITLKDEAGNDVKLSALKKAVIFAYPKANTGGCTKQACTYRDDYSKFQKLKVSVYGLSNDNATPLKNWKEKNSFPYALLSDPERKLIGALTGSKSSTTRSHFVVDGQGRLALSSVGVKPGESSASAYEAAQKL
ncbi:Alkyl hydroperoxide reductase, thiol specific antioxidant and related enzymes [Ceraceosorus bombacis]|uniref:thioredoxin-dependent peroxiredoxin n=1 Tax=Ceraceosorus bombacis TaxID=401625 RepID=A0A0P1BMK9_9BASI|nr:Alkyl hydroperoxide reductase, thiol specific antioxidant and related enzymes [Ceraceosorus bombacis]